MGWLPITNGQGTSSIMIMYNHDSNLINAMTIKLILDNNLVNVYEKLYTELQKAVIKPLIQKLDNELSNELIQAIEGKT